jgi:hypothetical protein
MSGTVRTLAEMLRALLVLALVFLNFAHQPAFAAPSAGDVMTVVASQSFCGTPIADDDGPAPCHACRIGGGADLPPVCELPQRPLPVAIRLIGTPVSLQIALYAPLTAGARAPPAA